MKSHTVAESEMSLESRSFLHRVNDQVREIQDQYSQDATQDSNKHSLIWRILMSSTLQASVFMGKKYREIFHSIQNTGKDLTIKQMFDISEKLIVGQSDEIHGVNTINWVDSSWKHLSLVSDEEVISLSHAKVFVFSDSVLCHGKVNQNPTSKTVWEEKMSWFKDNTIHPEPEIHEHIYVTKRLRNNVYNYKHILTYIERNVNNCVNNATHADELTVQH